MSEDYTEEMPKDKVEEILKDMLENKPEKNVRRFAKEASDLPKKNVGSYAGKNVRKYIRKECEKINQGMFQKER